MRFAFLVPPADYQIDWRWAFEPQAEALREAGASVEAVRWTSDEELTGYDLVLPLVAWGYHKEYPRWLAQLERWEQAGLRIVNPVPVLRWNGDKAYLAELGEKGIDTVPTLAFDALSDEHLADAREQFGTSELVVKPAISASAFGTHRLGAADRLPEEVRGWRMLVQPWLGNIISSGEYSLIFFDGAFSHCVSKVPRPGEFRVQPEWGGIIRRADPPEGSIDLALAALAAAPARTTYARVDLVVGNDGELLVIELELIEPALFMAEAPDSHPRFAAAVLAAAEQPLADR
ncbi:MAG: hypothetical protein V4513_03405 [Pseudomonadota bacterium]